MPDEKIKIPGIVVLENMEGENVVLPAILHGQKSTVNNAAETPGGSSVKVGFSGTKGFAEGYKSIFGEKKIGSGDPNLN